ncbi:MAG: tetratricopeptide repeat protein [Proteobacteria bacterium]|nr:tetratricopeptide repeat protein [Pseudomonadota bacterium]
MGTTQRSAVLLCLLAVVWFFPISTARAQTDSEVQLLFDQAFKEMLQDPSNLDKTFKYAELGIKIGDFEAAISALERMLLYNPDLPRVRLELGVLYFRLGSYSIARAYLTRAVVGDNVPDDVRSRVAVFLDEIDNRLSHHKFFGSLFGGMRYQTNANVGPKRPAINLLNGEGVLDNKFTRKDDWNVFLSANVHHIYDPHSHSGDVLETDVLFYSSQQFSQHQLDLVFAEATVGPRGQFLREFIENATWRPHIIGSVVNLDASHYYYTYGAGFDFDKQINSRTNGTFSTSLVRKKYRADAGRPTARLENGDEAAAEVNLYYQATDDLMFTGSAGVTALGAERSSFSNRELALGVGTIMTYGAPYNLTDAKWTTSLDGMFLYTRYSAPDPTINSFQKRKDHEIRATLLTSVPINKDWSVTSTLGRTVVDSNFLNYSYNNWAASIGASMRF